MQLSWLWIIIIIIFLGGAVCNYHDYDYYHYHYICRWRCTCNYHDYDYYHYHYILRWHCMQLDQALNISVACSRYQIQPYSGLPFFSWVKQGYPTLYYRGKDFVFKCVPSLSNTCCPTSSAMLPVLERDQVYVTSEIYFPSIHCALSFPALKRTTCVPRRPC